MNIILMAIPLFIVLIAIELVVDRIRQTNYYRFNDFISSLNLGIFSRITGILKTASAFSVYLLVYQHFALTQLESSIAVWVLAFVGYDLAYYWSHRLNHQIAVMWGSHVVHHSGEEYNLTTALRQTGTFSLFGWALYLPLAVAGIPLEIFVACASLNLIYQFWVHTRHIKKMPVWFEAIMVTPSHHRVHHALNWHYINKNYSGVFIIWDKWFGSFQAEKDDLDIVYGVSHQLASWNPIWANVQVYWNLLVDCFNAKRWRDKLLIWFKDPGWRPDDLNQNYPRPWVTSKTLKKYDVEISTGTKVYLSVHFVVFLGLTIGFLSAAPNLPVMTNALLCLVATINLFGFSAIQEKKRWAFFSEMLRLSITSYAVLSMLTLSGPIQTTAVISSLVFILLSLVAFYLLVEKANHEALSQVPQSPIVD
jgi:sterol desaturase/sphingolipid hydroxylase (fatty acid hydroxylase superfamily)